MNNKQAEELLNALLSGEITAREFKRMVKAPKLVLCMVFEPTGPDGEALPGDVATVTIDGQRQEMPFGEYQALQEAYPTTIFVPPFVFSGTVPPVTREEDLPEPPE